MRLCCYNIVNIQQKLITSTGLQDLTKNYKYIQANLRGLDIKKALRLRKASHWFCHKPRIIILIITTQRLNCFMYFIKILSGLDGTRTRDPLRDRQVF